MISPGGERATSGHQFVEVYLDPCAAAEDGLTLRYKGAAGAQPVEVLAVPYESEDGEAGTWRVLAVEADDAPSVRKAFAILVEDSSDGTAWLVVGGTGGLRLEHVETGRVLREPYLVLARGAQLG